MRDFLSATDREQILSHGISEAEIERQLRLLSSPPPPADLLRPCRLGDGIVTLSEAEQHPLIEHAEAAAREGRLTKFVPASGAATRMFKAPLSVMEESGRLTLGALEAQAREGSSAAREVLTLVERLAGFAFARALHEAMSQSGSSLEEHRRRGDLSPILEHLLHPVGLGYGALPKGLILFHDHPRGPRTAFEEQLAEGVAYLADESGRSRFHLTVPAEFQPHFEATLEARREALGEHLGNRFEVSFSTQDRATDTLAVDLEHRPFRREDGSLLLRPGGHGSLLGNLQAMGGDVVVVKNIDNVLPEARQRLGTHWKKVLIGLAVSLQREIFHHLELLAVSAEEGRGEDADDRVRAAAAFAAHRLGLEVPATGARAFLLDALDRPLRVCGMVENQGEPGGGPFWVRSAAGRVGRQIVESAQINTGDPGQKAILGAATHFNPVDLVCALRNRRGQPFELSRFVDPATAFVTEKTLAGARLKALEHPGLWNGAMAGWTTVFVEVPAETFAPVKTVLDLLRPEHQSGG